VVRQETCSYSTRFNKRSIHYTLVFQIYDVLRFDSIAVINVLINIIILKLSNHCLKLVHEYASDLTITTKAELLCSCKSRKFIGQSKVKLRKL